MANQTFDTTILNPLERPLSSDLNAGQSQNHRDLRDYLMRALAQSASFSNPSGVMVSGFVGDGFRVTAAGGLNLNMAAGVGFQNNTGGTASNVNGVVGLNDLSPYAPLLLSSNQSLAVNPIPGPGFSRIDLIQVKVTRRVTDPTPRDIFNPGTLTFGNANVDKTMTFDLLGQTGTVLSPAPSTTGIGYKVGVAFAGAITDITFPPNVPATDAGYLPVAAICLDNSGGAKVAVVTSDIVDYRKILSPYNGLPVAGNIYVQEVAGVLVPVPASSAVYSPPGLRTVVLADPAILSRRRAGVYILGWSGITVRGRQILPDSMNGAAGGAPFLSAIDSYSGIVDAALQAIFADPAQTAFPMDVAIGQPYVGFEFETLVCPFAGGPTIVPTGTDMNYTFRVNAV